MRRSVLTTRPARLFFGYWPADSDLLACNSNDIWGATGMLMRFILFCCSSTTSCWCASQCWSAWSRTTGSSQTCHWMGCRSAQLVVCSKVTLKRKRESVRIFHHRSGSCFQCRKGIFLKIETVLNQAHKAENENSFLHCSLFSVFGLSCSFSCDERFGGLFWPINFQFSFLVAPRLAPESPEPNEQPLMKRTTCLYPCGNFRRKLSQITTKRERGRSMCSDWNFLFGLFLVCFTIGFLSLFPILSFAPADPSQIILIIFFSFVNICFLCCFFSNPDCCFRFWMAMISWHRTHLVCEPRKKS